MGINAATKKLQDDMAGLVNSSSLPAVNVFYVVKEIYEKVAVECEKIIQKELAEEKQEGKEQERENGD